MDKPDDTGRGNNDTTTPKLTTVSKIFIITKNDSEIFRTPQSTKLIMKRTYKCEKCGKCLASKYSLERHIATLHTEIKIHKCNFCQLKFTNMEKLQGHTSKDHATTTCRCMFCFETFDTMAKVDEHIYTTHDIKGYNCAECGESFPTNKALKEHKYENHPSFPCNICKLSFTSRSRLNIHKAAMHPKPEYYECDFCKEIYANSAGLKAHIFKNHQ